MERLGDRYLVGDALGHTESGQVHAGAFAGPGDEPGTEIAVLFLEHPLATAPGAVDQIRELVGRVRGLGGPNLVAVLDVVADGQRVALITGPLPHVTLRAWLDANGPVYPAQVAQLGAEIAAALQLLHDRGLLHLALTPENVRLDGATTQVTGQCVGPVRMSVGRDALVSAMPRYVAPEIIRNDPLGYGADMYALGIVLYEACCGVPPFVGALRDVLSAHLEARPGVLKEVPLALRSVLEQLLAKDPADRPDARTAQILLTDLAGQLSGVRAAARHSEPPIPIVIPPTGVDDMTKRRRRRKIVIGTALAAAAAAVAAFLLVPGSQSESPSSEPKAASSEPPGTAEELPTMTSTSATEAITEMPDLVGTDLADARTKLPSGIDIETDLVVGEEGEDGVIKAQEPSAGEPIGDTVRLTVARPLVPVQLDSLEPIDGYWSGSGVGTMSGDQYLHSLSSGVDACDDAQGYVEYNVSREYRGFRAQVGLDDSSRNDGVVVQFEVTGDSRPLGKFKVAYGKPVPVDVDIAEVLRLRVQWQVTSNADDIGCDGATLSLGDPRLDGFAEHISPSGVSDEPSADTEITPTS